MTEKISRYQLEAAFARLKKFDCTAKEEDFVEVALWHNGEGFDVTLCTGNNSSLSMGLTWGEFRAIKRLVKKLDKEA